MKKLCRPHNPAALHTSNVFAHFVDTSANGSFHPRKNPSRTANKVNLSFYKTVTPSKLGQNSRKMRESRSCAKGLKAAGDMHLTADTRLSSIYSSDFSDPYTFHKKERSKSDAVKTLHKISESLERLTRSRESSVYNCMGAHKRSLNKKGLAMQRRVKRPAQSVKRRGNRSAEEEDWEEAERARKIFELMAGNRSGKDAKGLRQKSNAVGKAFNEVIGLNWRFRSVLKQIQIKYQEVFLDYEAQCKGLEQTLEDSQAQSSILQLERDKLKAEIKELAETNAKLLNEINKKESTIQKLNGDLQVQSKKARLMKMQADKEIKGLSEDINLLYTENKKLTSTINELCAELRERQSEVLLAKGKEKTVIGVGKNEIKIPRLDLSSLVRRKPAKLKVVQYYNNDVEVSNCDGPNDSHIGTSIYYLDRVCGGG